ncbi:MAG: pitrilysin family protein [bacterium]|nr:pitrilysin family protein [bacterium]
MKKINMIVLLLLLWPLSSAGQESYQLGNGLTVILIPDNKVPLVTFQVWVRTGSIQELNYPGSGISHFVEHLLFTDTRKRTGLEIARFMKQQGCDMNGYTSFENTVYLFNLPSENLPSILPVAKEMIFEPAFKKEQVEKERSVILKEINMNVDDPNRLFSNLIFSESYEEAFYRYPVIGKRNSFERLTRDDIIRYYQNTYVPDNMALILSGDLSADIRDVIQKNFGALEKKFFRRPELVDEPVQIRFKEKTVYRNDVQQDRIALVWKTVDIRHKDLFSLDVLSMLLSTGRNSILNLALKEKLHYVNNVSTYSFTPVRRGIFTIEADLNPGISPIKVKNEILKILKDRETLITEENLDKIKLLALRNYYKNRETINSKASDIGLNWVSTGDIGFSEYYTDGLRSVTRTEIMNVIKKYFYNSNLTYIAFLKGTAPQQDNAPVPSPGRDQAEKHVLENRLKIVINENKDQPFIRLTLMCQAGLLYEPEDKKGISHFLSKLLISTTENLTKEALIGLIEEKGGTINAFSGNNSIGLNVEVFKENLPDALQVISETVLHPNFQPEEMEKYRTEILQEIKDNQEQIFGLGKEFLFREMYPGYDYAFQKTGTEESVRKITQEDIRKHFSLIIRPSNAVISISGDLNSDDMKKKLTASLGKWPDKKNPMIPPPFTEDQRNSAESEKNVDKEQSLILMAYYGISVFDPDRIKAELLWYMLNGQGSRIFTNLREKKELAYYAGFFPFHGLTTGLFVFYAGTIRDKLELARQGLLEEMNELIKKGVTKEELNAVKKEFIAEKMNTFQANEGIVSEYGLEYLFNDRIIGIQDYKNLVDQITLDQMNGFIKEYFSRPYRFVILKGR